MVGVALGGSGVGVSVGTGVSLAKMAGSCGGLSPVNQTTIRNNPTTSRTTARAPSSSGIMRSRRRRYAEIPSEARRSSSGKGQPPIRNLRPNHRVIVPEIGFLSPPASLRMAPPRCGGEFQHGEHAGLPGGVRVPPRNLQPLVWPAQVIEQRAEFQGLHRGPILVASH